jgi:lysozyme family protein
MTQASWPAAIKAVLASEGGYVNDPHDPGGETNFGISKRAYPGVDIAHLTQAGAEAIYKRDYWDKISGDELPAGVDYTVFDEAVNSGVGHAARSLQAIVGSAQDGAIGPQTIRDVMVSNAVNVISRLCDRRLAYLQGLPTWSRYGTGWTNRVVSVKALALRLATAGVAYPPIPAPIPTPSPPKPPVAAASGFWARLVAWARAR